MREVVRDELQRPPDSAPQNLACRVTDLIEPLQEGMLPGAIEPPFGAKRRAAKPRIERVRHAIDLAGAESGVVQTEPYRILGKHVRVVDERFFCMLDAGEALLFAGGHHLAIANQCG